MSITELPWPIHPGPFIAPEGDYHTVEMGVPLSPGQDMATYNGVTTFADIPPQQAGEILAGLRGVARKFPNFVVCEQLVTIQPATEARRAYVTLRLRITNARPA
ncbi:MAG: hypothetical protein ACK51Q_08485 [Betaproteobacteria bacterium]|jgi:hypothetical protein